MMTTARYNLEILSPISVIPINAKERNIPKQGYANWQARVEFDQEGKGHI